MAWNHRPALDGVRSVAVYLVVLFHAGVAAFGGGFIGVDLFFVLSGFLVSTILLDELDRTGRIRVARFYARRVRRLLPAAVVAVVGTAAVYLLVASTAQRLSLVGDARAALLYVANWRFLGQSNDYFAAEGASRSPYLHFWSLSIEEQFYILFPPILLGMFLLARRRRGLLPLGVGLLLVVSLGLQLWWAGHDVNHAYYATETRAYQLLAGVAAALVRRQVERPDGPGLGLVGRRAATAAGVGGVVLLVVCASSLLDLTPSTRGILGTLASVGLVLGLALHGGQLLGRVLAAQTPAYLGRISYGTYLWHWPVVLVLLLVVDATPWVVAALTAVVATALAALSFHVLEHPVRASRALARFSYPTIAAGVAASLVAALVLVPPLLRSDRKPVLAAGPATSAVDGAGRGRPVPDVDWQALADDEGSNDSWCTLDDTERCVAHQGGGGLTVMLAGDSEASALAPAMTRLAEERDFTLALSVVQNCSWQPGLVNTEWPTERQAQCRDSRDALYGGLVEALDVDVVVLAQTAREGDNLLTDAEVGPEYETADQLNLATMEEGITSLVDDGADVVTLQTLLQIDDGTDPLECLSAARTTDQCRVSVPLERARSDGFYRTLATTVPGVATVDINPVMCPRAPVCDPMIGDLSVWRDPAHYAPKALTARREPIWELLTATGLFDAG